MAIVGGGTIGKEGLYEASISCGEDGGGFGDGGMGYCIECRGEIS